MTVPIRNIYWMLAYAWNALEEAETIATSEDEPTGLADLLGAVLASSFENIMRHGLDRSYREHLEEVPGVRGRIMLEPTISRHLDRLGRTVCAFDELTVDVAQNRIVKATALRLLSVPGLDGGVAGRLAGIVRRLPEIASVRPDVGLLRSIRLHRNNQRYALPIEVCRLVLRSIAVDERSGHVTFRDFTRDEHRMRALFERFVRSFYEREQSRWRFGPRQFSWSTEPLPAEIPKLVTDITLCHEDASLIIETKFNATVLVPTRYGKQIRPAHLRQLFAYLEAEQARRGPNAQVSGVILYGQPEGSPYESEFVLREYKVRVSTLDLSAEWGEIRHNLLDLVGAEEATIAY